MTVSSADPVAAPLSARQRSLVHRIAALALDRPDADLIARLPSLRTAVSALDEPFRSLLGRTLDHLDHTPLPQLATEYRPAGLGQTDDQYPVHLCVVLDVAATAGPDVGTQLLVEHRTGLERLRLALTDAGSPYADALAAVAYSLPPSTGPR